MKEILRKVYNHLKQLKTSEENVNGEKSYIFVEKNMCELDKTCCDLHIIVFDFDQAKEKINKEISRGSIKMDQPKSCDALKVCYNTNKFDLIEMKGIQKFIDNIRKDIKTEQFDKLVDKKINEYNEECKEKLRSSCEIIRQTITNNANIELTKKEKEAFRNMSKNYYLLTDYSGIEHPRESFAINLLALSHPQNSRKNRGLDIMMEKMKNCIGKDIQIQMGFSRPIVVTSEDLSIIYSIGSDVNSAS